MERPPAGPSSGHDLCDVFEQKLCPKGTVSHPRTNDAIAAGRMSSLHRTSRLFETCGQELLSPTAMHRIMLSGASDCYISTPPIHHGFPKGYSVSIWVRMNAVQRSRDITLFRMRASNLCSTECTLTLGEEQGGSQTRVEMHAKLNHRDMESVGGRVNLDPDMAWHLVTVVHQYTSFPFYGTVAVMIDGEIALEQTLDYPFKPMSALSDTNTILEIGAGLTGCLGVVSVYAEEISPSVCRSLADAGPAFVPWVGTAGCPQHSNETGHCQLFLNYDKLMRNGSMKTPICYVTARHFNENLWLPCISPGGRAAGDRVELEGKVAGSDILAAPAFTGSCVPHYEPSLLHAWEAAGGSSVVLFLLHAGVKEHAARGDGGGDVSALRALLLSSVRLLAVLLRVSVAMRACMLQEHGFHVLSLCLRSLPSKRQLLDVELVDACMELVKSLGTDLYHGDGVAAALQGLLFNFSVWRHATLAARVHLLRGVASLSPTIGGCLRQFVGLQRIFDLAREHVITFKEPVISNEDEQAESAVLELAVIVLKDAQADYERPRGRKTPAGSTFGEIEVLFACIEETHNSRFAERLILHAIELLYGCPAAFVDALTSTRFYDVTAVKLLTRDCYSAEMRRAALHLFLWGLVQAYPDLSRDILYWLKKFGRDAEDAEVWYQHDGQAMILQSPESDKRKIKRPLELLAVLKAKKDTLSKMWNMICMVSGAAARAVEGWRIPPEEGPENEGVPDAAAMFVSSSDRILSMICHDGPVGALDCWMALPWMGALMPSASLSMCQRVLVPFSMALKINEHELAALSVLPDCQWVHHLLTIAGSMHDRLGKSVDVFSCGNNDTNEENKNDAVETFASIARSCLDVAMDSLAQVIVYQIIHFGDAGRQSWQQLIVGLQSEQLRNHERAYLRQAVLYVFQKISRNHCGYNRYVLFALTRIVQLVEEKQLCGNRPNGLLSPVELRPIGEADVSEAGHDTLSPVENKLLMFTVELSQKIRQGCEGYSLGDSSPEIKIIILFLSIFTGCLSRLPGAAVDSVCAEIEAIVVHSIDGWLLYSPEYYRLYVLGLFDALCVACHDDALPSDIREKYKQAVVTTLHFFMAIRRTSTDDIQKHYPHVSTAVDVLSAADDCYNADEIFTLINVRRGPRDAPSSDDTRTEEEWTDDLSAAAARTPVDSNDGASSDDGEDELFATELSSVEDEGSAADPVTLQGSRHPVSLRHVRTNSDEGVEQPFYFDLVAISHSLQGPGAQQTDNSLHRNKSRAGSVDEILQDYDDCGASLVTEGTVGSRPTSLLVPSDQENSYARWMGISSGILADRVDTERARMERFHMSAGMTDSATSEFWIKVCRKLETETFGCTSDEMWELAMRYEGQFPGRQRIVLLPWFLRSVEKDELAESVKGSGVVADGGANEDTIIASLTREDDHMREQLVGAYIGHDNFLVERGAHDSPELDGEGAAAQHGQSWSVIDMDEGESGGYGVVGLERLGSDTTGADVPPVASALSGDGEDGTALPHSVSGSLKPDPATASDNQDTLLDLAVMAEGMQQGREVETAPCFPGTKKLSKDVHVAEVSDVSLLTAVGNFIGTISFTEKEIFFSTANDSSPTRHLHDDAAITLEAAHKRVRRRQWFVDAITGIFLRSYRLRQSGVEVLFSRGKYRSFFVDFGSSKGDIERRNSFLRSLCQVAPRHAIKQRPETSFHRMISTHGIQQEWVNGRVSNFDYLMYINTIAGRSFNDLCQYPVMPWVIAQYEKDTIDLTDPATFRDLSKPMGAQTEERLERIRGRYEALAETEDVLPPFMYGSHYSTMVGVVLYYLLRLQPYAELHKVVQGGHFDSANRLFASVKKAWKHNSETTFEVKELTPEWFTLPDFLRNTNNFDLGQKDDSDTPLGDVELPTWAASPEDFIRINRDALESDYVSSHLHEWIDLIFGCKQRGAAAIEADNLFYYLTYPGAIDRDKMDATTLESVDAQIAHFGQCPFMVFDSPHPAKVLGRRVCVPRPLRHCFSLQAGQLGFLAPADPAEALVYNAYNTVAVESTARGAAAAVVGIKISGQRIFCIRDNGQVNIYRHKASVDAHFALKQQSIFRHSASGGSDISRESGSQAPSGELCHMQSRSGLVVTVAPETRGGIVNSVSNFLGRSSQTDGTALHRLPMQRMKNRYEGVKLPSTGDASRTPRIEDGFMSIDDLAIQDACRTHFVGRQDDVVALTAGRPDGLIYVHSLESYKGEAVGAAYFSGHRSTVTFISHDSKRMDHSQNIICSCDQDGVALLWVLAKKLSFLSKSYSVCRHPVRLFRAHPSAFTCCDLSLELGIVVVGSRNLVSVFSIEYNMKLRDIDITKDICNTPQIDTPQLSSSCYIKHIALSNYGSVTLFVEKEISHQEDGVVQTTHILASYSVNGNLAVLVEVPAAVTCLYCPKKESVLFAGCSDGAILFLLQGSLEIIHNIKPSENCKICKPNVPGTPEGAEAPLTEAYPRAGVDSAITCIRSGPSPEYPALVVASNTAGDVFLIPLPDYIRWDKIESSKNIISNIVQTPISALRGTLQHAQSITGQAAGSISKKISGGGAAVGGAISRFASTLLGGRRGASPPTEGDAHQEATSVWDERHEAEEINTE